MAEKMPCCRQLEQPFEREEGQQAMCQHIQGAMSCPAIAGVLGAVMISHISYTFVSTPFFTAEMTRSICLSFSSGYMGRETIRSLAASVTGRLPRV